MKQEAHEDLACALEQLGSLAPESTRNQVVELQRRLREDQLRVLVLGEAKRGKSTFINALLGAPVLPMGVAPLTAASTTVTYGTPERVELTFEGGRHDTREVTDLPQFVTEEGNPGNHLRLTRAIVYLEVPLLALGIELVDTPGTGSVHAANTIEAESARQTMDAVIFVLAADPPISASERDLLKHVASSTVATFVVLNKVDRHDSAELAEATSFAKNVVHNATDSDLPVYACSARKALANPREATLCEGADDGGTPAIQGFLSGFLDYLHTHRSTGLITSLRKHANSLAASLLDEVRITLRADALQRDAASSRIVEFRAHLAALQRRHQDAADRVRGESDRMLAELNKAANQAEQRMTEDLPSRVRHYVTHELAESKPAGIEKDGLHVAIELIKKNVEPWRQDYAEFLQRKLDELDSRLRAVMDSDIAHLQPAAEELLGIQLTPPPTEVSLVTNRRFHYLFLTDMDTASITATTVRRQLPGPLGRRRSTQHLLGQVRCLTIQQIGRARADLQQRLQETTRQFLITLQNLYADYANRLSSALDAADQIQTLTANESAAQLESLARRQDTLRDLMLSFQEPSPRLTAQGSASGQPLPRTSDGNVTEAEMQT